MAWIQAALLRKQISTNFQAYICAPRKGKNVFKCLKCHSEPFKPFLNISLVKHNSEMLSCIQMRALELVLSTNLSADYSLLGLLEANHKSRTSYHLTLAISSFKLCYNSFILTPNKEIDSVNLISYCYINGILEWMHVFHLICSLNMYFNFMWNYYTEFFPSLDFFQY